MVVVTHFSGRITAGPSANIFTNREQEMISRSSNLRRLSFVLLAADQNHYLTLLPAIQEKLVDILRTNVVSPRVHSEVNNRTLQQLTTGLPVPASFDVPHFGATFDKLLASHPC